MKGWSVLVRVRSVRACSSALRRWRVRRAGAPRVEVADTPPGGSLPRLNT
jgi:hypothetical protein